MNHNNTKYFITSQPDLVEIPQIVYDNALKNNGKSRERSLYK